jgi:SAM-dependent methyltransferase
MRVKRNFNAVYAAEQDPWGIGNADSERYAFYYQTLRPHIPPSSRVLDIGCGQGAFLARFTGTGASMHGLELAAAAIERGRRRFPSITFYQGSATALDACLKLRETVFDLVICSDIIYYLKESDKQTCLDWIAEHLAPEGLAFVAAWCPGGKYLRPEELENLVLRRFGILSSGLLSSGHAWFACRKARAFASLTWDYETWHPIPAGKHIDWRADILDPTDVILDVARECATPMTFFIEMGEILWLREHEPDTARLLEEQIRRLVKEGHAAQLHLHPSWLPELGAKYEEGQWFWDWRYKRMADCPGDLTALIGRLKSALEAIIAPTCPGYRVTCFRAGAYACQPFKPLYEALAANGITCDSSVYPDAVSAERGYDFSHAYSRRQPYFASAATPQLKAPPAEQAVLELPLTVLGGSRLHLDGVEAPKVAGSILRELRRVRGNRPSSERLRLVRRLKLIAFERYCRLANRFTSFFGERSLRLLRKLRVRMYKRLPAPGNALARCLHALDIRYPPEIPLPDEYFVCIGHTKGFGGKENLRQAIALLRANGVELRTLSALADRARVHLAERREYDPKGGVNQAAVFQVEREYAAVMQQRKVRPQSLLLQAMLPLDRRRVLDLGCGSGLNARALHERYPWLKVFGLDAGRDFIAVARKGHAGPSVSFAVGLFTALPCADGAFDAVYADNTLEHAWDIRATLAEVHRVLEEGGCLLAAVPPDGYVPDRVCDNHTWKTTPEDARVRLEGAGFTDVTIREVDARRELGEAPFPPSRDKMLYILAWKRSRPVSAEERARILLDELYRRIEPGERPGPQTVEQIFSAGRGLCADYALAAMEALRREGCTAHIRHIVMRGHPHGRGPDKVDTHTLVEAVLDGKVHTLDPTLNLIYPASIAELRQSPALAGEISGASTRDERWKRGYELYCSAEAWASVFKVRK